jgi:iron complex transport system substrate-binding protein
MRFKFTLVMLLILWITPTIGLAGPLTVKDMAGRTISLKAAPQRIICLGPGALRLIVYLGAQDLVVGVESMEKQYPTGRPYFLAQPQLKALPAIGPGGAGAINKKPDMEAVLRVAPDLIVATYMEAAVADEVADTLGIPVLVLSYGELAVFDQLVYDSLRLAGKILDRQARADAVIDFIKGLRKDLERRSADISDETKPGVYVGGIGYRGTHGIESTQGDYIPLDWNHAVNVAQRVRATVGGHVLVDKEILLGLNPDVIFIDGAGLPLMREDYRKKPGFYQALTAVTGNASTRCCPSTTIPRISIRPWSMPMPSARFFIRSGLPMWTWSTRPTPSMLFWSENRSPPRCRRILGLWARPWCSMTDATNIQHLHEGRSWSRKRNC